MRRCATPPGVLRAAAGNHEDAIEELRSCAVDHPAYGGENPAMFPWRSAAALSLAELGREQEARALADDELARARSFGAPRAIGIALRARALVGPAAARSAALAEALAVLEDSPARLEHARVLVDIGATLRAAGQRSAAREPLLDGLTRAARCGARALERRARSELAAIGVRPRGVDRAGPDSLTASERRVAEMAAQGGTNREIAQTLFVTEKTVETHLGRAFRKLDITSRRQLPDVLAGASRLTPRIDGARTRGAPSWAISGFDVGGCARCAAPRARPAWRASCIPRDKGAPIMSVTLESPQLPASHRRADPGPPCRPPVSNAADRGLGNGARDGGLQRVRRHVGDSVRTLHAGISGEAWALSGMALGLAAALLSAGALADDLGHRRGLPGQRRPVGRRECARRARAEHRCPDRRSVVQGVAGAGILASGLGSIGRAFPRRRAHARDERVGSCGRRWGDDRSAGRRGAGGGDRLAQRLLGRGRGGGDPAGRRDVIDPVGRRRRDLARPPGHRDARCGDGATDRGARRDPARVVERRSRWPSSAPLR